MDPSGVTGAAQQLAQSLARLVDMAADYGRDMLERAEAQIAAERRYRVRQICCIGALLLLVPLGLLFTGVAVIVTFWDSHRVAAAFGVAGAYFLLAVVAVLLMRSRKPRPASSLVGLMATAAVSELVRRRR